MCEHRILLLQLTRTSREVRYGTYDGNEGLGLWYHGVCDRRHNDNDGFLGWQHLGRTPWDVIHDIQRCLRHSEEFFVATEQLTAVYTFITVIAGISYGSTYHGFEVKMSS
jgi:hypothetical protein